MMTNASFLQSSRSATHADKKLSVKVKVFPSAPLDIAVKGYIDAVGRARTHLEQSFFEEVCRNHESALRCSVLATGYLSFLHCLLRHMINF